MSVYRRARFRFALIGGNLTAQSTRSHRGTGGGIQISETKLQALLPFPAPPPERPGGFARRLSLCGGNLSSEEGSPAYPSYPGRAKFPHISLKGE